MQHEIFEIVDAAIERLYAKHPARRVLRRAAWRANVRLRLALTLGQRLRSGHVDAACALWHGLLHDTGRQAPDWLERRGERIIRRWCGECDARPSVIPL